MDGMQAKGASMLVDSEAQRRLTILLEAATDKRKQAIEPEIIREVKKACKASDSNVKIAFDILLERLKLPHAQTRLFALELCDQLFTRSKAFRGLLAPHFTHFLELTVGFRAEKPLPPPAAVAQQLREKALEVIERWNEDFGAIYKQVAMGCRYLKDTLKYNFPELRAREAAAQAERLQREARAQEILLEKYRELAEGFEESRSEVQLTLTQLEECFVVIDGRDAPSAPAIAKPAAPGSTEEDGLAWEEVGAAAAEVQAAQSGVEEEEDSGVGEDEEGLAAYATTDVPDDLLDAAEGEQPAAAAEAPPTAPIDADMAETLRGLHKQLLRRHLPDLQEALKILTKVDVGERGSQEHTQHGRILRAVIALREQTAAADAKFKALLPRLPAETARPVPAEDLQAAGSSEAERVRISWPSSRPGNSRRGHGRGGAGDSRRRAPTDNLPVGPSPYESITDPAASKTAPWPASQGGVRTMRILPKAQPQTEASAVPAAPATAAAAGQKAQAATKRRSVLPENVKQALLQQAPEVPHGAHLAYWDSSASMMNVRGGMEVSNHWGPTDAHTQLPPERLSELFGAVATYYTPAAKGSAPAAKGSTAPAAADGVAPKGSAAGAGAARSSSGGLQAAGRQASTGTAESSGTDEEERALQAEHRRREYRKPTPTAVTAIGAPAATITPIRRGAIIPSSPTSPFVGGMLPPPARPVVGRDEGGSGAMASSASPASPRGMLPSPARAALVGDVGGVNPKNVNPKMAARQPLGAPPSSHAQPPPPSLTAAFTPEADQPHHLAALPTARPASEQPTARPASGQVSFAAGSSAAPAIAAGASAEGGAASGIGTGDQRLSDRAYNAAVLGAHASDEQLAQALQRQEVQQAAGRGGRGGKRKVPPPVRDRLAKKLLSGRAHARAMEEVMAGEQEAYRERVLNRWEEK